MLKTLIIDTVVILRTIFTSNLKFFAYNYACGKKYKNNKKIKFGKLIF